MRRIAISGHRGLPERTARLVDTAIRSALADQGPEVTGISCLADGADQIFARAVIDLGGRLEVVIPAAEYRGGLPEDARPEYDKLHAQAVAVDRLPFSESTSQSHMAASKLMLDAADELYAVWDGQPARGYGGTADVVSYARERGVPVRVIWPAGAHRDLRSLRLWSPGRGAILGGAAADAGQCVQGRFVSFWEGVQVLLGCGDAAVAESFLDDLQVAATGASSVRSDTRR